MVNMLHIEADFSKESSDWQSYSEDSGSSPRPLKSLGLSGSTRTLNFSHADPVAHEPANVRCPLLAAPSAPSIDSHPRNQSASARSSETSKQPYQNGTYAVLGALDSPLRTPSAFPPTDASRPVFLLPIPSYYIPSTIWPATFAGMDTVDVPELVERLGSEEDAVRKMAVFKLQSNIGDPSFAEIFIQEGGLEKLKYLAMRASGNTLAYSLTSFSRLLEVDKGWDFVEQDLIERVGKADTSADMLRG